MQEVVYVLPPNLLSQPPTPFPFFLPSEAAFLFFVVSQDNILAISLGEAVKAEQHKLAYAEGTILYVGSLSA